MATQKVAGCCQGGRKVIIKLRFIRKRHWSRTWVRDSKPGDLLLLGDRVGKCGALLRLPSSDAFLTLTADQVWRKAGIPWPDQSEDVVRFTIQGQQAEVLYR